MITFISPFVIMEILEYTEVRLYLGSAIASFQQPGFVLV